MMAYRLAADASKRVAAVASVAGQVEVTEFAPTRPVAVIEFHSTDDPRAVQRRARPPFPGTALRNQFDPVQQGIDRWVAYDGCRRRPTTGPTEQGQPGSGDEGETATKIVDANELMWEFFAEHPLPKR